MDLLLKLFIVLIVIGSGTPFNEDSPVVSVGMLILYVIMLLRGDLHITKRWAAAIVVILIASVFWLIMNSLYSTADNAIVVVNYSLILLMCFTLSSHKRANVSTIFAFFVRVVLILAIVSMAIYALISIGFDLPTITTISFGGKTSYYYLLHISENNVFGFDIPRNTGIYWEPGMYMVYLNLIWIYYLFNKNATTKKKRLLVLAFCAVAIFTTGSITGYLLAFASFVLSTINIQKKSAIIGITIVGALALTVLPFMTLFVDEKMTETSYVYRSFDLIEGFNLFLSRPIFGYGLVNNVFQGIADQGLGVARGNTNGLITVLINLGIVGFFVYLVLLNSFASMFSRICMKQSAKLAIIIWLIGSCMNEPLTFHPSAFLMLGIGYALQDKRTAMLEINSINNTRL